MFCANIEIMKKKAKNITTDELAVMVKKGFDETNTGMSKGFTDMNIRLDRIENSILKHHSEQILMLDKRLNRLENLFAVK